MINKYILTIHYKSGKVEVIHLSSDITLDSMKHNLKIRYSDPSPTIMFMDSISNRISLVDKQDIATMDIDLAS